MGHLATQKCTDEGGVLPLLHALEGGAGENEIGARAENLLDTISDKEGKGDLRETIGDLNKKIHSKNSELLNLQTALGQYYAEIDAKDHLERELASVRQESAKLSELLKEAYGQAETTKQEKMEIMEKLRGAERVVTEIKGRVNKLEENNSKLRRALEQSMTRLNRMSMDSDFSVDRPIVIKLLVTYFQRNHSKEDSLRTRSRGSGSRSKGWRVKVWSVVFLVCQVALDVHDDDGDNDGDDYESEISNSRNSSFSDRRTSLNHGRSFSPMANGHDSTSNSEVIAIICVSHRLMFELIAQYKLEIKRLQDSEAQIKALSVNYAALLKQKEVASKLEVSPGRLSMGHLATQKCTDEGGVLPLLHALEGGAGENEIGARAENLLDTISDKEGKGDLRETIGDLNKKIHSKNSELLNLQTALGQYYAEIDAKDHLERELASVRQESAKLSELLKEAYGQAETTKQEKMEIMEKLRGAERVVTEVKGRVNKLEENNSKLRRALEQSMTRLNRMLMDSDFSVDRPIVIKLLVTYFQRNHSKEDSLRTRSRGSGSRSKGWRVKVWSVVFLVCQVALDVHDDDGDNDGDDYESEISNSRNSSFSDRRTSLNHGRSFSPMANGHDSTSNSEVIAIICVSHRLMFELIAQYKLEIKRLQDSEAQIKALSVNYAALLKQKEGLDGEATEPMIKELDEDREESQDWKLFR
ncbi:hypothetical protein LXL04_023636 [Taraxacum kok-saghyz]